MDKFTFIDGKTHRELNLNSFDFVPNTEYYIYNGKTYELCKLDVLKVYKPKNSDASTTYAIIKDKLLKDIKVYSKGMIIPDVGDSIFDYTIIDRLWLVGNVIYLICDTNRGYITEYKINLNCEDF